MVVAVVVVVALVVIWVIIDRDGIDAMAPTMHSFFVPHAFGLDLVIEYICINRKTPRHWQHLRHYRDVVAWLRFWLDL